MTAEQLLNQLAVEGGIILRAKDLSPNEIERAHADNRFCKSDLGVEFVRLGWNRLTLHDVRIREFIEAQWFERQIIKAHDVAYG